MSRTVVWFSAGPTSTRASAADAQHLLDNATPGPWRTEPDTLNEDLYVVEVTDTAPVAAVDVGEHQEADAELIAAAPDLAATVIHLHAENERLRAELDRRTNPDLAARLTDLYKNGPTSGWRDDIRAAARLIDGEAHDG